MAKPKLLTSLENIANSISNIINGITMVGNADKLDGYDSSAFATASHTHSGYAPTNHANPANSYGIGTAANFGHVKTINDLTQVNHIDGTALSAYQGYLLRGAAHLGKNSKMRATSKVTNGSSNPYSTYLPFNVKDKDDFNAINIPSNNTRITIPNGVSKARFYFHGDFSLNYGGVKSVISLHKNGIEIERLMSAQAHGNSSGQGFYIEDTFFSSIMDVKSGDYFQIYYTYSSSWGSQTMDLIQPDYIFGMEAML